MKIRRERDTRSGRPEPTGGKAKAGSSGAMNVKASGFLDTLRAAEKAWVGDLEELLAHVDVQAERLRHDPSLEHLRDYKLRIRQLVDEAVRKMYSVQTQMGFERHGQRKLFILVRTIDEQLEELTRLILNQEADNIAIAARLDEIRGMLLDMYR